jgi:pSer/pThr/pTyr-binding forkhead associated (FHA) protein
MAWVVLPDGTKYPLEGATVRVGRDGLAELALPTDTKVSRIHAEFRSEKGQWVLADLGSRNGTTVNQRRIGDHPLKNGDVIALGNTTLLFVDDDDPYATEAKTGTLATGPELTDREREVLALVATGLTDRDIGERLFVSPSTVRSHLDRIGQKTGLRRRAELTRYAMDLGIVN